MGGGDCWDTSVEFGLTEKCKDFIPTNEGKADYMGIVSSRLADVRMGPCRSFLLSSSTFSVT